MAAFSDIPPAFIVEEISDAVSRKRVELLENVGNIDLAVAAAWYSSKGNHSLTNLLQHRDIAPVPLKTRVTRPDGKEYDMTIPPFQSQIIEFMLNCTHKSERERHGL